MQDAGRPLSEEQVSDRDLDLPDGTARDRAQTLGSGSRREKEEHREPVDYDFIFQGLALANPSVGGRGGVAERNRLRQENAALKASIEVMKGTSAYRVARKIADANIPFKEQLKKQAKKLLSRS